MEINLLGVILAILLFLASLTIFAIVDRKMLQRVGKATLLYTSCMAGLAAIVWLMFKLDSWWASLLWTIIITALTVGMTMKGSRLSGRRSLIAPSISAVAGMIVGCGVMLLCLGGEVRPSSLVLVSVIMHLQLTVTQRAAMRTYVGSLQRTREHYIYLLSNGATHAEAIMPSVKRGLRAAVMPVLKVWVQPMFVVAQLILYAMLVVGTSVKVALLLLLAYSLVGFAVSLLCAALLIWLTDKFVTCKFDR